MAKISEKELEDYIFKNYKNIEYLNGDFIIRQLNIKGYGIIDILIIEIIENYPIFKILELKQDKIDHKAIEQICKYINGFKRNLEMNEYIGKNNVSFENLEYYLIGQRLSNNCGFLTDNIENLKVITYKVDLEDGISFNNNNNGWYRSSEKINYSITKYTKKAFENNYKKNGKR